MSNGDMDVLSDFISSSNFNNENVFSNYLDVKKDLTSQVANIESINKQKLSELEKEFKIIQVTSQNILSISSGFDVTGSNEDLKSSDLVQSLQDVKLSNDRVLDLIS